MGLTLFEVISSFRQIGDEERRRSEDDIGDLRNIISIIWVIVDKIDLW
jgi:hypothetical protein